MVLETCKVLMQFNEEFRKNTVKQVTDFLSGPEHRTADIVPSIPVFIAQLFTLCQLPDYNQYFPEADVLTRDRLFTLFRFAFEEQMRRSIKDGVEPFTKAQVLKILFPDAMSLADALFKVREKQILMNSR